MGNKRPRHLARNAEPPGRQPSFREDTISADGLTPAWQFHRCDMEHPHFGWQKLNKAEFEAVLAKLRSFEGQTWGELLKAAGGRTHGTNHHAVPANKCIDEARKRLSELKLDDLEDLFSLRLTGTLRLYGIREGRVLILLWHDPHHGTRQGAYPTANTL